MELRIQKLLISAKLPVYAQDGDAGFDLYAIESVVIPAGARVLVGTGIVMEIPDGYSGLIWDKSGLSNTYGLKTLGGVVDAGYRGEVRVGIVNLSANDFEVKEGNKIAQMLIQKVEHPELILVEELSETERGANGFGSTGE